ncbi:hypothetical protein ACMD2_03777 [Ananas comosus]|uniref:C2 domain-containing protein n=1 Tax=Ananas comosus TaxID=4615 RepID=A0A199V000_ANACO|nr:hypothetical protein ACMD2_03777 [Ananas comosus]
MKPSGGGGGGGGGYLQHRAPEVPFHLLEITVISAQDLHPWSRRVRAYAAAWVRPDEKLHTQVDRSGNTNPTWNDKFVFRVDGAFLRSDTSAVTVSIHASRPRLAPRPDPVLGVVRVLLCSFLPRRVAALQVRRPASLRPQGILNVAVALLDPYILSMPLSRAPPAFVLKDLPMAAPRPRPVNRSGKRIDEEEEDDDDEGFEQDPEKGALMVDRSGPLEERRSAEMRERRELESKIEKWKTELSPEHDAAERKSRSRSRRSSCFCGGPDWER